MQSSATTFDIFAPGRYFQKMTCRSCFLVSSTRKKQMRASCLLWNIWSFHVVTFGLHRLGCYAKNFLLLQFLMTTMSTVELFDLISNFLLHLKLSLVIVNDDMNIAQVYGKLFQ